MTATLIIDRASYEEFRRYLAQGPEEVGFFLADYDASVRSLRLRNWRAISAEGFEHRRDFHLTLRDQVRADVIKWAWDNKACLVEAHSHLETPAAFSPSDLWGLEQWIPHIWWRLRGRPYAAIVTAGQTFDALAWIDGADSPEQVEHLSADGLMVRPTGLTLTGVAAYRRQDRGE